MKKLQDRSLFCRLEKKALKVGLHTNKTKTEYMIEGRRDTTKIYPTLNLGHHNHRKKNEIIKILRVSTIREKLN